VYALVVLDNAKTIYPDILYTKLTSGNYSVPEGLWQKAHVESHIACFNIVFQSSRFGICIQAPAVAKSRVGATRSGCLNDPDSI
jgi:hypothetical protein